MNNRSSLFLSLILICGIAAAFLFGIAFDHYVLHPRAETIIALYIGDEYQRTISDTGDCATEFYEPDTFPNIPIITYDLSEIIPLNTHNVSGTCSIYYDTTEWIGKLFHEAHLYRNQRADPRPAPTIWVLSDAD